jgi:hypothetical protein
MSRYGIVGFLDSQRAERDRLIDMAVREARDMLPLFPCGTRCSAGCGHCARVVARYVRNRWPSILSRAEENAG